MFFKREVFKNIKFDEKMKKYALAEDFDFSYRVNKRFPHSLFITPEGRIIHRASTAERLATEKISYMNQINHFYLNYKNFNSNLSEKIRFVIAITAISILRIIKFLFSPRKNNALKLKYYFSS